MSKRRAFLHIGLDDGSGDVIDATLDKHPRALAELGVRRLGSSHQELTRIAAEMLHAHQEWGYSRAEVEGAWTSAVEANRKGHDTLVLSAPMLAATTPDQAALLLDALAGFQVHVVVTAQAPDAWSLTGDEARDLGSVLTRWSGALGDPARLHVVVAEDPQTTWRRFGEVVGFGTRSVSAVSGPATMRSLPTPPSRADVVERLAHSWMDLLTQGPYDVCGDVGALAPTFIEADDDEWGGDGDLVAALAEVKRLRRRTEVLEQRVTDLKEKRKSLKRRLKSA